MQKIGVTAVFDISAFTRNSNIYIKTINKINVLNQNFAGSASLLGRTLSTAIGNTMSYIATRAIPAAMNKLWDFGASAVALGVDFQQQMAVVKAAVDDPTVSMGDLSDAAIMVGNDVSVFGASAIGAAEAMTLLYKGGLSTNAVFGDMQGYLAGTADLGGGVRAVFDLVAASELTIAQASDAAVVSLSTFGRELETDAEKANFINEAFDYMVRAANASVSEVEDITAAFGYVGPAAATAGLSIFDVTNSIALLSQFGIKGTRAGTALTAMMANLTNTTAKSREEMSRLGVDVFDPMTESMYPLIDIIGQFEVALEGATDKQIITSLENIFGLRGGKAMKALMEQGIEGWNDMAVSISDAIGIEEQAALMMDTLAGKTEIVDSSIETLKIQIEKGLDEALQKAMVTFNDLIQNAGPGIVTAFENIGSAASSFMDILTGDKSVEDFINAFESLKAGDFDQMFSDLFVGLVSMFGVEVGAELFYGIEEGFNALKDSAIGGLIESIVGYLSTLSDWWDKHGAGIKEKSSEIFDKFIEVAKNLIDDVLPFLEERFDKLSTWWDENGENVSTAITNIGTAFGFVLEKADGLWGVLEPLLVGFMDIQLGIADIIFSLIAGDWEGAWEAFKKIGEDGVKAVEKIFTGFATWVSGWFGKDWETVKDTWSENWDMFKDIVSKSWEKIKTAVSEAWESLTSTLSEKFNTFISSVSEIWETIKTDTVEKWESIKSAISGAFDGIKLAISEKIEAIVTAVSDVWERIKASAELIWTSIKNGIIIIIGTLLSFLIGDFEGGFEMVRKIFERLWTAVVDIAQRIYDGLLTIFGAVVGYVSTVWEILKTTAEEKWESFKESIIEKANALKESLPEIWENIQTAISEKWEEIIATAKEKWETFKASVQEKVEALRDLLPAIWEAIKTAADAKWEEFKTMISTKIEDVKTTVETGVDNIKTFIEEFSLKDAGEKLITGFIDGIKAKAQSLIDAVGGVVNGAIAKARELLNMDSPSKVFMNIGENVSLGMGIGIQKAASAPIGAIGGVVSGMTRSVGQSITNQTTNYYSTNVEVNPTYRNYESEAGIYYDVAAALGTVRQ